MRSLCPLAIVLVLMCCLGTVTSEFAPPKWNAFDAVISVDALGDDAWVDAALSSLRRVAAALDLGKFNTKTAKDAEGRLCDYTLALRAKLNNQTTSMIVITNATGEVPDEVLRAGPSQQAFVDATEESLKLNMSNTAAGIRTGFAIVCSLLPAQSSHRTVDSFRLPTVFPSDVNALKKPTTDFAAAVQADSPSQLMEKFNMSKIEYPVDIEVLNATNVVPWVDFGATSLRSGSETGSAWLINSPLRSLNKVAKAFLQNISLQNALQDSSTLPCTPAVGIVLPQRSNSVLVVTDRLLGVPLSLYSNSNHGNLLERTLLEDRGVFSTKHNGEDAVDYRFAFVCADLSSVSSSYTVLADLFPPLVITEAVEIGVLEGRYDAPITKKYANGKSSEAELMTAFGMVSLESGVFFPQSKGVPPFVPSPLDGDGDNKFKDIERYAILGLAVVLLLCVLACLFRCCCNKSKRSSDDYDGDYDEILDTHRRV